MTADMSFDINNLKEGFNLIEIDTDDKFDLSFDMDKNIDLFIRIKNVSEIDVNINVKKDNKSTIIFWNESKSSINSLEKYTVEDNGELDVVYGECNDADTNRKIDLELLGNDAKGLVSSASLVRNKKNYVMNVINTGKRTLGNIKNYAVVLKDGKLMIDAVGKINAGAKKAQSHQTSRALAFESGQSATILPELLIDENDVQASHAMTIGRVDEAHLYYLMSRGLDIKQCTMLISHGYLMPLLDYISDEELKERLRDELERKIQETCLM